MGYRQRDRHTKGVASKRRKGKVIKLTGNGTKRNKLPGRDAEVPSNTSDETKRAKQKIMSLFIKWTFFL